MGEQRWVLQPPPAATAQPAGREGCRAWFEAQGPVQRMAQPAACPALLDLRPDGQRSGTKPVPALPRPSPDLWAPSAAGAAAWAAAAAAAGACAAAGGPAARSRTAAGRRGRGLPRAPVSPLLPLRLPRQGCPLGCRLRCRLATPVSVQRQTLPPPPLLLLQMRRPLLRPGCCWPPVRRAARGAARTWRRAATGAAGHGRKTGAAGWAATRASCVEGK